MDYYSYMDDITKKMYDENKNYCIKNNIEIIQLFTNRMLKYTDSTNEEINIIIDMIYKYNDSPELVIKELKYLLRCRIKTLYKMKLKYLSNNEYWKNYYTKENINCNKEEINNVMSRLQGEYKEMYNKEISTGDILDIKQIISILFNNIDINE